MRANKFHLIATKDDWELPYFNRLLIEYLINIEI